MNYENAKDILPDEVLKLVQSYAAGKLLYVPIENESKNWGEISGYRQKLMKRNIMICNKYISGMTISELADEYFLSLDSIKKIIYCKKNKTLEFSPTLPSAISYSNAGMAEEWIQSYFIFCRELKIENNYFKEEFISFGVAKIPLRLIQPALEYFDSKMLINRYGFTVNETEPLIVRYENKRFYVDMQNELLQALKNRKVNAYPAFILTTCKDDYKHFMNYYGQHFIMVNEM